MPWYNVHVTISEKGSLESSSLAAFAKNRAQIYKALKNLTTKKKIAQLLKQIDRGREPEQAWWKRR